MFNVKEETLDRIDNIEKSCIDIDEYRQLMTPLVLALMETRKAMDIAGIPEKHRATHLDHNLYKEQYEKGVNRCMGIDILWE